MCQRYTFRVDIKAIPLPKPGELGMVELLSYGSDNGEKGHVHRRIIAPDSMSEMTSCLGYWRMT